MRLLPVFALACLLSSTEAAGSAEVVADVASEELGRWCKWRGPYKPAYSPGCDNGCKQFTNLNHAKKACARRGSCGGITYEKHRGNRWRWELRRGRSTRRSPHGETTYLKGSCRNGNRPRGRGGRGRRPRGAALSKHVNVRGSAIKNLAGFCGGKVTVLSFNKRQIKTNNLGGLGPKGGPGGPCIWWTNVGKLNGRNIDLTMTPVGGAYGSANAKYKRWGRSGKWFAKRFHGSLKPGVGSAGSMKKGRFVFLYKFMYSKSKKPATIAFLPLTFYDLDGGKEFIRTYDAVGVAASKPTGMQRYGCKKKGGKQFCFADGARREYPFPRNFDRLTKRDKMPCVTFLFQNKASFKMIYKTTYDHRVFMFKGSEALICKGPSRRRVRGKPSPPMHRRRASKQRRRAPPALRRRAAIRRRSRKCNTRVTSDPLHGAHRRRYRRHKMTIGCR